MDSGSKYLIIPLSFKNVYPNSIFSQWDNIQSEVDTIAVIKRPVISNLIFLASNILIVLKITVKVFNPYKSNFTKPAFSDECISN